MGISEKDLDKYVKARVNVLMYGERGVGKTSLFLDTMERNKKRYLYFSGSTLDPYVDLVGVPVKVHTSLEFLRPDYIIKADPEIIFIDEFNRCFTGDTLVALADGREVPIRDLVGIDEFFVYSYDITTGRMVVGRGHSARKTISNAKLINVELDNGEVIRCTPDHRFLNREGVYVEAQNLNSGDALMPLYRKLSDKDDYMPVGYEQVYQPQSDTWTYTHRLADEFNVKAGVYSRDRGTVRHHIDFNKANNSPRNIQRMTWSEHKTYHKDLVSRTIMTPESMSKAHTASGVTRSLSKFRELRSQISKKYFASETARNAQAENASNSWKNGNFEGIDRLKARHEALMTRALKLALTLEEVSPEAYSAAAATEGKGKGRGYPTVEKVIEIFGSFQTFEEAAFDVVMFSSMEETRYVWATTLNHKVVRTWLEGEEDVYDITVDEYHNFALSSGVVVHNSHKKVRNAVMELIQFRTINGVPFSSNLESVWAACNPDSDIDDDYDTDRLDPAQRDRFQIQIEVPSKPDQSWFVKTYGSNGKAACNFWHALPPQQQKLVSPRRLAYALDWFAQDGNLSDVLDKSVSHDQLRLQLKHADISETMTRWAANKDAVSSQKFFADANNYTTCEDRLLKHKNLAFFLPLIPRERLSQLYSLQKTVRDTVARNFNATGEFKEFLRTYASSGSQANLKREAQALLDTASRLAASQSQTPQPQGPRAGKTGDPEWFLAQMEKGRKKETMYNDVVYSWNQNYMGTTLSKADVKSWSRLLGKLTNSIWTKTLNGPWSGLRPIVEELLPQGDFSKIYPDFLALKNKYQL
jgi:Intein splicing domain